MQLERTEEHWLTKYIKACEKNVDRSNEYKELTDAIIKQPAIGKPKLKLSFDTMLPENLRNYEAYKDVNEKELKEHIDKLADELKQIVAEDKIESKKRTCFNCSHFHPTLNSPETDSFFHIHNYCDAWRKSFDGVNCYSRLCQFIDENIMDEDTGEYKIPCGGFFDDFEIGKAGCYRFNPVDCEDVEYDDNRMREYFENDKELALKLADYMIEHPEIPEDVEYYEAWKDEIKKMRFED